MRCFLFCEISFFLFVFSSFLLAEAHLAVNDSLNGDDRLRIQELFQNGIKSSNLEAIYYSAVNIKDLLNEDDKLKVCSRLQNLHSESKFDANENDFYFVGIHHLLGCTTKIPAEIETRIETSLSESTAYANQLYFNYFANKYISTSISDTENAQIIDDLQKISKNDENLTNMGYAFKVIADIKTAATNFMEWSEMLTKHIEKFVDDTSKNEEHFYSIAMAVSGILKLRKATESVFPFTEEQLKEIISYALTFRWVDNPRSASILLEVLNAIADDREIVPICIGIIGDGILKPDLQFILIKVHDILGNPLKSDWANANVTATVTSSNGTAIKSNIILTPKSSDRTVFELNLDDLILKGGSYNAIIQFDQYQQIIQFNIVREKADTVPSSASIQNSILWPITVTISIFVYFKFFQHYLK